MIDPLTYPWLAHSRMIRDLGEELILYREWGEAEYRPWIVAMILPVLRNQPIDMSMIDDEDMVRLMPDGLTRSNGVTKEVWRTRWETEWKDQLVGYMAEMLLPSWSYGSPKAVDDWMAHKGVSGMDDCQQVEYKLIQGTLKVSSVRDMRESLYSTPHHEKWKYDELCGVHRNVRY